MFGRTFGFGLALTAILLWALFSNVAKSLFQQGMGVTELTAVRITVAAALLWLVALAFRPAPLRLAEAGPTRRPLGDRLLLAAFGLSLWAMMFTFYKAIFHLGVALGIILQFTHPLLIILFGAIVLKERFTPSAGASVACILVGVVLLVQLFETQQVSANWTGIGWGLASAVANAAYLVVGRYVQERYRTGPSLLWGFGIATLLAIGWGAAFDPFRIDTIVGSATMLINSLGISLFGTLGAFALMLLATHYISPLEVGLTSGLEAVFAGLLAMWWFGETLSGLQLTGAALVIGGVSITYLKGVHAPSSDTARDC
ncbi:DMT family transporter [Aquamicrobium segne]|uniref:DMT family transporter n=1 Tax=Aquamicrobium segne TaxID=469547 RepID=A0ABW0GZS7_9HYPH